MDESRRAVVLLVDHQETEALRHRSVKQLAADINKWAAAWNENPTPFVWHKTADQILERLAGYCTAVNENLSAST